MFLILGVILLTTLIYYYMINPLSHWRERGILQKGVLESFHFSWFGIFYRVSMADNIIKAYNDFPGTRYYGLYQFNVPTMLLKDVDLIKQMVIKDFDHFNEHRAFAREDVDPMWAKNLFSLTGNKWRNMRSTLSPSFTSSKMKGMFVLMKANAERFVNFYLNQNKEIIQVEMKEVSTRYSNDVIASTAFGFDCDSLAEPNNEFYIMGKNLTAFGRFSTIIRFLFSMFLPNVAKLFNIRIIKQEVGNFFTKIIEDSIKMREQKGLVRPDMIHLLLEARKGNSKADDQHTTADTGYATVEEHLKTEIKTDITNEDIVAQALVFFFAGFDSSSNLMSFMGYELCANPDIQDRLREEIKETLENCNEKLTYEALVDMKYMDMVVTETLRKWPAMPAMDRICTKPYTIEPVLPEEKPVQLIPGDIVTLPIYSIHHDPELFPDPETFDPERFSEENKADLKPYSYMPFGLGPRNCIGSRFALLETKILFFYILKYFKIVPVEKSDIPIKLDKSVFQFVPSKGITVGFERIKL
ncbi:cytochrome P450 9e2 [Diabrotica virgifera virgifera]|uniref:Cytochrome P450 9e2-like n=1 Tax=Diabrotica virgifera virgifera TaxID=50390 RepID=A0ABM5IJ25_DIAVI|nr:cytochrome P450 9e2 [Diabrotica virgifera virgifera]XP_028133916.2 cytochrome P450 9e2 [Diabrotica virgifera virgifera]